MMRAKLSSTMAPGEVWARRGDTGRCWVTSGSRGELSCQGRTLSFFPRTEAVALSATEHARHRGRGLPRKKGGADRWVAALPRLFPAVGRAFDEPVAREGGNPELPRKAGRVKQRRPSWNLRRKVGQARKLGKGPDKATASGALLD